MIVLTDSQADDACQMYLDGLNLCQIGAIHGVPYECIRRCLISRNIPRRDHSHAARKFRLNENYFTNIDSESKAYWLGFIAADGSVRGNTLRVTLHQADEDHLQLLRLCLESEAAVRNREYEWKRSEFLITSSMMVKDLNKLGIVPHKALTMTWPKIPSVLMRHWLRGFIDGDGSFYVDNDQLGFSVVASLQFACEIQEYLHQHCNVPKLALGHHKTTTPMASIPYTGNRRVLRIANHLYKDATIFMPRKWQTVEDYLLTRVGRLQKTTEHKETHSDGTPIWKIALIDNGFRKQASPQL